MKSIVITSDSLRHIEFVERIKEVVKPLLIFMVPKKKKASRIDNDIMKSELNFFHKRLSWVRDENIITCDTKQLHSKRATDMMIDANPDYMFVFGGPLLRKNVFQIPRFGAINIHTGLVNHYRGVDSTYWALYDNRPDLIGTTLHYIDDSIDGGNIIQQNTLSNIQASDTPESLFIKACNLGFDMLVNKIGSGIPVGKKNIKLGKLFQKKDMNDSIIDQVKSRTSSLLEEYLVGNNSRFM